MKTTDDRGRATRREPSLQGSVGNEPNDDRTKTGSDCGTAPDSDE